MNTDRLNSLLQMHEQQPDDSFIRFALAKEYENAGDLAEALKYYSDLKRDDPDYVGLYYHLAKLHEVMDNESDAMTIYDQGIEVAGKLKDFHALSELNNARANLEMGL